jgi:molybdate transport system permease protein
MADLDFVPFLVSLRLALETTAILLCLSFPLAWVFARSTRAWTPFIESLFTLPLVLPPTVLGFYLLVCFAPGSGLGDLWEGLTGSRLVFTFQGLVVASCVAGFPFMLNALRAGIQAVPRSLIEASATLGKGFPVTFLRVVVPCMRASILSGVIMTFAHTLGEFGVVLMIGGSIPGATKVASIAIYEAVEAHRLESAHAYALILVVFSYACVLALNYLNRRGRERV